MRIQLKLGDCIERMRELGDGSIDVAATDPPYFLGFMNKEFDTQGGADRDPRLMQKVHEEWLREVLRVLKPGSVIRTFSGTRTYHRLAAAMEQVGFVDIGFNKNWLHGQGFPKSTDISKSVDRMKGAKREVVGTKRGVGGENLNDIVRGDTNVRSTDDEGGKGVGAYGTGAKQVAVEIPVTAPATPEAKTWDGYGTALKPSWEPVLVGRKP